jgi:hypothetical protein
MEILIHLDILYNIVNYVKKASKRTKVDFSSTKQFDATAGDPYSTIRKK